MVDVSYHDDRTSNTHFATTPKMAKRSNKRDAINGNGIW